MAISSAVSLSEGGYEPVNLLAACAPAVFGGRPPDPGHVTPRPLSDAAALLPAQSAFPHPCTPEQQACVELLGRINADITTRALGLMAAGNLKQVGCVGITFVKTCNSKFSSPVWSATSAFI